MVKNNCLILFLLISVFLVITTASSSSDNSTKSDEKSQKREDGDSDDDSSSSDSSSSDSGPSPIHSSFPIGSPFAMFPRMPFPGPMSPFGMYRPYPPMGPPPMAGSPIGSTGTGMAASMMRQVMSPFHGHPAQAQPLFAPMSPLGASGMSLGASGMSPMSSMGMSPMSSMGMSLGASGMAANFPTMRRAWEPHHQSLTGHSLLDQLLHSDSHSDPLSEPFGSPLLGSEPIEQMDEEEFYEKLRQHQRERQSQVASRREFRESARDSYRDSRIRRPYQRNQIPPPPPNTHSYDDRHRDNGGYHDNRPDPYEPMQEENRHDRGHHPGENHRAMDRENGGNSNYLGNNQRDPMEYDDRPPVDGPPNRLENRPLGPPGEDRPPYVRRSIHDERSPDYGVFDDKKA